MENQNISVLSDGIVGLNRIVPMTDDLGDSHLGFRIHDIGVSGKVELLTEDTREKYKQKCDF